MECDEDDEYNSPTSRTFFSVNEIFPEIVTDERGVIGRIVNSIQTGEPITKADLFLNKNEVECGKKLIKRYLPSVFAKGSGIDAAITTVSLI